MTSKYKTIPKSLHKLLSPMLAERVNSVHTGTSGYVHFGPSKSINSQACFRSLPSIFNSRKKYDGNMYYLLKLVVSYISYEKILSELSKYFKGVTKMTVYKTHADDVVLVQLIDKEGIPDKILYCAYFVLFVIFRAMDREFAHYWISRTKEHTHNIEMVEDLIKYYITYTTSYGHGINDGLVSIYTNRDSKLFESAVRKYITTLEYVCGKKHNWKELNLDITSLDQVPSESYSSYMSQTPSFDFLEKISMQLKKKEKGEK